jgi:DNA-binding transcriptional LysR family regulator
MNIRILRIVECVARHQSFSRAAEEICLSNAAISAAVTKAEEDIGLLLFDRSTRHVRLTPLGERFMPRMRLLIRDHDDLMRDLAHSVKHRGGRVRVGCLASVAVRIMPQALARCRGIYPDLQIEIRDAAARAVYEEVSQAVTDFAIVGRFEPRSDLNFETMLRDPMVLICPSDSPLARCDHVDIDQLAPHPFIMMSRESAVRAVLRECQELAMDRLRIIQEVAQLSSVIGMVRRDWAFRSCRRSPCPDICRPTWLWCTTSGRPSCANRHPASRGYAVIASLAGVVVLYPRDLRHARSVSGQPNRAFVEENPRRSLLFSAPCGISHQQISRS